MRRDFFSPSKFPLHVHVSIEAKSRAEIVVALKKLVSDVQSGADRSEVSGSHFTMYAFLTVEETDKIRRPDGPEQAQIPERSAESGADTHPRADTTPCL